MAENSHLLRRSNFAMRTQISSMRHSRRRWPPVALGTVGVTLLPGVASGAIPAIVTPSQTRGPFYPRELPLERDNDLTRVQGGGGVAAGVPLDLTGSVSDERGRPL